jgi:hypothetical protein
LHCHALLTLIAYLFLQHRRLQAAKREKECPAGRRNRACRLSGAGCLIILRMSCACDVRSAEPASPLVR